MNMNAFVNTAKPALSTINKAIAAAVKLIGALCLVVMLCAPAQSAPPAKERKGKVVLAFGDSLTAGYGLANRGDALPQQLQTMMQAKGYRHVTILNAGVSGDTTAGGVTRLPWMLKRQSPDYVILALGGNDMLRAIDPASTRDNLRKMLEILKTQKIPVLLVGMRAPANMGEAFARAYETMYAELAKEYGAVYYPFILDGVAMQAHLNLRDGVHPNAAGIKVIAEKMLPYVEQLVRK